MRADSLSVLLLFCKQLHQSEITSHYQALPWSIIWNRSRQANELLRQIEAIQTAVEESRSKSSSQILLARSTAGVACHQYAEVKFVAYSFGIIRPNEHVCKPA